jgi:RNA polymerase sigma factor (sigma-70 family)
MPESKLLFVSSTATALKKDYTEEFEKVVVECRGKFVSLVTRYYHCNNAEDVVQSALLQAWEALPHFKGESSIKTWLGTIVRNEALTYHRGKNLKFRGVWEELKPHTVISVAKEDSAIYVEELMAELPVRMYVVVKQHYWLGIENPTPSEKAMLFRSKQWMKYRSALRKKEKYFTQNSPGETWK